MIPSLLQIPSAVSDSKLHSVLPNNGKGDFTFDRSTGATRINRDGLIEEVGYFSSELVQNGNFSELGSELIVNGDFATDSNWIKGAGWSISNGKASKTGSTSDSLYQSGTFLQNKTYKLSFSLTNTTQGNLIGQLFGGGGSNEFFNTTSIANGNYTFYVKASINRTTFGFYASGSFDGSIDNVSVKQVDPNDRWTLGSQWAYVSNGVLKSGSTSQNVSTGSIIVSGTKYQVNITVSDMTTGTLSVRLGGNSGDEVLSITSDGSYKAVGTAGGDLLRLRAQSSFDGKITSVSVVEVQGDRPRLSYDITNGVVEDKPHLLLEPSRTNLVTDYLAASWDEFNGAFITANNSTSPDGTSNATLITFGGTSNELIQKSSITILSGSTYSISGYFKLKSGTLSSSNNDFKGLDGLSGGAVGNSTFNNLNNTWQRLSFSVTSSTTSGRIQIKCEDNAEILVYGLQLELGSFSTSIIPTAGTTITRAAETCNNSKPSVNSTEGVLYAEIKALANDGTNRQISISNGTVTERVYFGFRANTNEFILSSKDSSYVIATVNDATDYNKYAFQYKSGNFKAFVNGVSYSLTADGGSLPTSLDRLNFDDGAGNSDFYGKVKGLATYNRALTDTELYTITSTQYSAYSGMVAALGNYTIPC